MKNQIKLIKLGWKLALVSMVAMILIIGNLFFRAGVVGATDNASPTPTPSPSVSPSPSPTPTPTVSPSPSPAAQTPPVFPNCIDQNGSGDKAHFDTGLHQIVGSGLLEGKDDVFTLSNGNFLQCFVPPAKDVCIQTDWWRTDQVLDGWFSVNGSQWDLGNVHFLAKNVTFNCTPIPSPSPTPTPIPTPTPSPTTTTITINNNNEQHQEQTNNQTTNVLGASTVTKAPETGVGLLGMTGMFSAAPFGFALSKFGRGKIGSKKVEDINEMVLGIFNNRKDKLS